jgi:hypothetical protein
MSKYPNKFLSFLIDERFERYLESGIDPAL